MNKYFDKAYCINLNKRIDRWNKAQQEFNKYNLVVERFPAIEGNIQNLETEILPGNIGCVNSHLNIIKNARKNNYKSVAVFEDDVEFKEDVLEKFEEYYKQLPENWDMIYFGGNHNDREGENTLIKISDNIYKVTKTYTTHAYIIKNTVYDEVIKLFSKYEHEVDVLYSELQLKFNCYVFRPHLAWQRADFSDIMNTYADYTSILK